MLGTATSTAMCNVHRLLLQVFVVSGALLEAASMGPVEFAIEI